MIVPHSSPPIKLSTDMQYGNSDANDRLHAGGLHVYEDEGEHARVKDLHGARVSEALTPTLTVAGAVRHLLRATFTL